MNPKKLFVVLTSAGVLVTGAFLYDGGPALVVKHESGVLVDAGVDAGVVKRFIQIDGRMCDLDMLNEGLSEHEACSVEQP